MLTFNISQFAPIFILSGVILLLFITVEKTKPVGDVLFGFGLVLFGISYISSSLEPLTANPAVIDFLLYVTDIPVLLFLLSVGLTALLHSSVAMIVVAMSFFSVGAMSYDEVIWLVLGANLGATFPVLLSSFSVSREGKKVALAYLAMKLSVVGLASLLIFISPSFISYIPGESERQIANFHTAFNIFLAVCWLPLLVILAKVMNKALPEKKKPEAVRLSERYLTVPEEALVQTEREVIKLSRFIQKEMVVLIPSIIGHHVSHQEIYKKEQYVDQAYVAIQKYLLKVAQQDLSKEQSDHEVKLLYMLNDLEQMGDIILQISNNMEKLKHQQIQLVKEDEERLIGFVPTIEATLNQAIIACEENNSQLVRKVMKEQRALNETERDFRFDHFNTLLQKNEYNPSVSAIYLDLVNQLMRLHHASLNISRTVLGII